MADPRAILCGGTPGDGPPGGPAPVLLERYGPNANVRLEGDAVTNALARSLTPALADLLDIAAYVYVADQAVGRGSPNAVDLGAAWRRHLCFRIPVREPGLWRNPAVERLLADVLGFLSDDVYEFDFRHWPGPTPAGTPPLDFQTSSLTGAVDEVVLFSGGLDSFAGAADEVVNHGRRVLLLNHRSNPRSAAGVQRLADRLTARCPGNAPQLMAVWANKAEELNHEYTQRARSFLYAALGAAVARTIGLRRVRFYENGVVSLNLPLSGQVLGARATRTTHPRVLAGFADLFSRVVGERFEVENPFLWKTKTEVVRLIAEAGLADAIGHANSCAHTWGRSNARRHCGECSQCVDRRFAVLAAEQAAHDPAGGYAVDLLTGDRRSDVARLLVAGYLETVNGIRGMGDPRQFFGRFGGPVNRVVPHLPGGADVNARRAYELFRRHACQVWGVVERGIAENAASIAVRELPPHCLLRQVVAPAAGTPAPPPPPPPVAVTTAPRRLPRHTFRSTGDCWEVGLAGDEPATLLPSIGAAYLHELLGGGGTVTSLELSCRVRRHRERYMLPAGGEVADPQAVDAYRGRIEELVALLAEARENDDLGAIERYQTELSELAAEVNRTTGLGGRPRAETSPATRARKAVGQAIKRAIDELDGIAPALAAHLRGHLCGGTNRAYTPPPGESWQL